MRLRSATLGWTFIATSIIQSTPAEGFVLLRRSEEPASAGRWSAAYHEEAGGAGLHDGLQVAIEPGIAERLAVAVTGTADPADVAAVDAALLAAFAAWENAVLRFEVELDGLAVRGSDAGAEIDVFLVPDADPVFADNAFFGFTFVDSVAVEDLQLTNGATIAARAFTRADIFLNGDQLSAVAPAFTREQQPLALQRLKQPQSRWSGFADARLEPTHGNQEPAPFLLRDAREQRAVSAARRERRRVRPPGRRGQPRGRPESPAADPMERPRCFFSAWTATLPKYATEFCGRARRKPAPRSQG